MSAAIKSNIPDSLCDQLVQMFVSIDNALSHIESQILPCTNLGIGRDDLLKRICDAAGEYFRCSDQDEQYQFVSIQTLKKLKQVQHSQINGGIFYHLF